MIKVIPLLLGVVPFGLVAGIAGVSIGLTVFEITLMSATVYAGAAQLVALQLMGAGASVLFVLLGATVVNLRYVMYSSAIAKTLSPLSKPWRALAAFTMTDQNFTLTLNHAHQLEPRLAPWFFLGAGLPMWFLWVVTTALGAWLGAKVPEGWSLDFGIPLSFLVLLVPALRDRPSIAAALVGGVVATALAGLPYRSGLFVGILAGIATGAWLETRRRA